MLLVSAKPGLKAHSPKIQAFIMIWILLYRVCLGCKYDIRFTDCIHNTLAAIVAPEDCNNATEYIVTGLPCDFICSSGQYLDLDLDNNTLRCSQCSQGTYSTGGGDVIASWNMNKISFKSYCWVMKTRSWELSKDCTPWHASSDEVLVSGTASSETWYEADLIIYTTLVKPGSLKVIYRKETSDILDWDIGDLFIYVDNQLLYFDFDSDSSVWKTATIKLKPGLHEIKIRFSKYTTEQISEVQIKEIEITGTSYYSKVCEKCDKGYGLLHSDHCVQCYIGTYLNNASCDHCPQGMTSNPGALSVNDCYNKRSCDDSDYYYYFSGCIDGYMKKIYDWSSPLMCNNDQSILPGETDLVCTKCPEGEYYKASACERCPAGSYIVDSSYGKVCEECQAGYYAPRVQDYSTWTSIPATFQISCISQSNTSCAFGWDNRGGFIITSPFYDPNSMILLEKTVTIVEDNGYVSYTFNTVGDYTRFSVQVNGVVLKSYAGEVNKTDLIYLAKGDYRLKWVFKHSDAPRESCSVHRIVVYGSDQGGSSKCVPCNEGYYSASGSNGCAECGIGYTSNSLRTGCIACTNNTYSNAAGKCTECPDSTIANKNHSACISDAYITLSSSKFIIGNLSGTNPAQSLYCSEDRLKMYCYRTFYGPVQGNDNFFYLSVINPSEVTMSSYSRGSDFYSYAFGIINKDQLTLKELELLDLEDGCDTDYSKVLVNIGNEIESIVKTGLGFNLSYMNGDYCNSTEKFSTSIQFVCDKREKEGWPIYQGVNQCRFEFYWPTVHACMICDDDTVVQTNGRCHNSERTVHRTEGDACVFGNGTTYVTWKEPCDNMRVFQSFTFIVAMLSSALMVLVVVFTVACALKTRNRYNMLMQYRSEGKVIELQNQ
jgi:hypothetical protein